VDIRPRIQAGSFAYAGHVRVLIVGGTGFIGGATARRLAADGHEVTVVHRGERTSSLPESLTAIRGDRKRVAELAPALRSARPEVVVDFVAFTGTDVRALVDVLAGCAQRLVVISSLDVYRAYDRLMRVQPGPAEPLPLREDAPLREVPFPRRRRATRPEDIAWDYDKIPVERAAQSHPGLPGTVLRLPAVFGPGDCNRHRVGEYLTRMDAGPDRLELDAGLARWRWTRCYVDDVADAVVRATIDPRAEGRTYNVGDEGSPTEGEWVRAIAQAAGYRGRVVEVARAAAGSLDDHDFGQDLLVDSTRIREELGWAPRTPAEEALARSVAWERQVRPSGSGA
jgi:nucleoside-diphosphate-sugar epimerase